MNIDEAENIAKNYLKHEPYMFSDFNDLMDKERNINYQYITAFNPTFIIKLLNDYKIMKKALIDLAALDSKVLSRNERLARRALEKIK